MIFVLQYLLLKFVSRYYENWVVKSWGYSQIERLLLLHRAVRCTCILGDNKGWKKIKVSQRPGETFGIVIWYKDDNHPLRLDRTPRSSSFFLLATQLSSTILHVHIAQPTTGPRCWFRGETRRLSLSLSRNRGPHTREKRISWLGTKRDVDESKARSFIPRLSLEISKKTYISNIKVFNFAIQNFETLFFSRWNSSEANFALH